MKKEPISYDEYKREIIRIYKDMRREGYYYNLLVSFLEDLLEEYKINDVKIIPVYLNTGYKEDAKTKLHDRSKYADSHSLQDIIIVPKQYEYENTTAPYVSIEVKKPAIIVGKNDEIEKYKQVDANSEKNSKQLCAELKHCNHVIFTDFITWYFLKPSDKIYKPAICLLDGNQWKEGKTVWDELKEKIKDVVKESKSGNV